jgi:pyruvate ferredoxin oxidoreductase gamma subunit
MIEIRIHGRGGQGNVAAAYMLATAAFEIGRYCQAFPNFGAERRGAPVTAFVRIAEQAFRRRNQVQNPAFLIIQDEALLHVPGVTDGLLEGGSILVNSGHTSEQLTEQMKAPVIALPASSLAKRILGRPVPNTALLAAFLTLTDMMPVDALEKAVNRRFKGDVADKNTQLIREAASMVPASLWKENTHAAGA